MPRTCSRGRRTGPRADRGTDRRDRAEAGRAGGDPQGAGAGGIRLERTRSGPSWRARRCLPLSHLAADAPRVSARIAARASAAPSSGSAVTALAPARYKVQFTARAELRDKLERLQALLGHDLATAIEAAVTEKLERLEAKRFGLTKTPRRSLDETDTSPRSRHLPAAVRRKVHERDGDQCTFLLRNGHRCPERRSLEFHHRHPYGRGGNHDPDNVCLMCRQHNAFLAELDYGKEHMESTGVAVVVGSRACRWRCSRESPSRSSRISNTEPRAETFGLTHPTANCAERCAMGGCFRRA